MRIYKDCPTCLGNGQVYKGQDKGWVDCTDCDEGQVVEIVPDK